MTDTAARFLVRGKVQGVCFRAGTRDEAVRLRLHGYARNLADGRVEVLAAGDPQALYAFAQWLRHGPPLARVEGVERHGLGAVPDAAGQEFTIA